MYKVELNYRIFGALIAVSSMLIILSTGLLSMVSPGSNSILALYYGGYISQGSALLSLTALGFPATFVTAYLFSTAGYVAFLQGSLIIFIKYTVLDVLGFWGLLILGAIIGVAA